MKKLLVFVLAMFVSGALATTVNLNWTVDNTNYAQTTCETGGDLILPNSAPTKYGYTFRGWTLRTHGKNLFDKNNAQMAKSWRVESDGKVYEVADTQTMVVPVKPNTTYTVQYDTTGFNPNSPPVGRINFYTEYPVVGTTIGTVYTNGSSSPYVFTTGNNTAYVAIWMNRTTNIAQQVWDSAQLEYGSAATIYEPYYDVSTSTP